MKVAVTGATGFIGGRLIPILLQKGDNVRILSRKDPAQIELGESIDVYPGDLTSDQTSLQSFVDGVDVLYHCAGEVRDESRMESVHVEGTRRLIEAASHRIGRWVQLSSVGAYGRRSEGVITEESEERPVGVYEVTKTVSDQLVRSAEKNGLFEVSILRPCKVLGPGTPDPSIFQLISFVKNKLFFFIGKPGASANYVSVENVAHGLWLCGTHPSAKGRIYNLSDYRTIESFVGQIASALGVTAPKTRLPEYLVRFLAGLGSFLPKFPLTEVRINGLTTRASYPITAIEKELDYKHLVSIDDQIHTMVEVWRQHGK